MATEEVLFLVQDMTSPLDRRVWLEATSLRSKGYAVTILCPRSREFPKFKEELSGVEIFRYPKGIEGRGLIGIAIEYVIALLMISLYQIYFLFRRNIRIIHVCNPPDFLILTTIPLRLVRQSKIIYDQHDVVPELWLAKGFPNSSLVFRLLAFLESMAQRRCDAIIFASDSFYEKFITKLPKNEIDASLLSVIKTAPRISFGEEIHRTQNRVLRKVYNRENNVKLVYLGRIGSQDGLDSLISAIHYLKTQLRRDDFTLELIGDGPEKKSIEETVKVHGISNIVNFHGYISKDKDLLRILEKCAIGICPDLPNPMNNMASMNKITEYMAASLPIVQFPLKENVLTAKGCSVVVTEANPEALAIAIDALLDDSSRISELSANARRSFVEKLCWEKQEEKLFKLYENLLK